MKELTCAAGYRAAPAPEGGGGSALGSAPLNGRGGRQAAALTREGWLAASLRPPGVLAGAEVSLRPAQGHEQGGRREEGRGQP